MDWSNIGELVKTIAVISIPVIEYFGLKKFNNSYMEEKGKNLATKEDIQELTALTEEIKIMYQSKQHQNEYIYDIKKDTIQESLECLDDYLSWLSYNSDATPVRRDISDSDLTMKARIGYNKLVLTCESKELPRMFLKIIFDDMANKMELYNKYRNLSRSELGIETELELDEQSVFLSKVSTKELSDKSKK